MNEKERERYWQKIRELKLELIKDAEAHPERKLKIVPRHVVRRRVDDDEGPKAA